MNRRLFIKRIGLIVGLAYVSPTGLIPETTAIKNTWVVSQKTIVQEALSELEWALTFAQPAAKQLALDINKNIGDMYK